MNGYHLALFIHLLALMAVAAASALAHLAQSRAARGATVSEVAEWHGFLGVVARVFPIAVLTFLATGGYMVSGSGAFGWGAGWVRVGAAGAVMLMASGAVLGVRHRRAAVALAALPAHATADALALVRDPVGATLSWMNMGIGISLVLVMTVKPGLTESLGGLVIGMAIGAAYGRSRVRAPAPAVSVAAG